MLEVFVFLGTFLLLYLILLFLYKCPDLSDDHFNSVYWILVVKDSMTILVIEMICYVLVESYMEKLIFSLHKYLITLFKGEFYNYETPTKFEVVLGVVFLTVLYQIIKNMINLSKNKEGYYHYKTIERLKRKEPKFEYENYQNGAEIECMDYIYRYEGRIKATENKLNFLKMLLPIAGAIIVSSDILQIIKLDNSIFVGIILGGILLYQIYINHNLLGQLQQELAEYQSALYTIKSGVV